MKLNEKWAKLQFYKEVLDSTIKDVYEELKKNREKKINREVQNEKNYLLQNIKEK